MAQQDQGVYCDLCGKKSKNAHGLAIHKAKIHKGSPNPAPGLNSCSFSYEDIRDQLVAYYDRAGESPRQEDWKPFSKRCELALIWDTLMCRTAERKFFNPRKFNPIPLIEAHSNQRRYRVFLRDGKIVILSRNEADKRLAAGQWYVEVEYLKQGQHIITRWCILTIDENFKINGRKIGQKINKAISSQHGFNKPEITCSYQIASTLDGGPIVCEFQYENIRDQLVKKKNHSFLELALIWDTCMCGTHKRKFFNPIKKEGSGQSTKKYRLLQIGEKLAVESEDDAPITLPGTWSVEVEYVNGVNVTNKMVCEFTIDSNYLPIGKRIISISAYSQPLQTTAMTCKIKVERLLDDHFFTEVVTEGKNLDLQKVFKRCAEIFSHYNRHGDLGKNFLTLACKVYDLLLLRPIVHSQVNHDEGEINTTPHKGCHICMNKRSYFEDDREGRTIDCILPQNANEQRFCEIEKVIYLIYCTECRVRYVGKTANRLKVRYRQHNDVLGERPHFTMQNHDYCFHILQIVEEHTLFDNEGFKAHVRHNVVPLEGVEKFWMDRLIDKSRDDLNVQVNYNYPPRHQNAMAAILGSFTN